MIAKEINITHTGQILASFIIGLCLCLWTALNMKPAIGVAIGFIPFATLLFYMHKQTRYSAGHHLYAELPDNGN